MNPQSPHDIPWQRLARYFAGELPPSEADELRRWINADPSRPAVVDELRELWTRADMRQSWDAEAALRQIKDVAARPVRLLRLPHAHPEAARGSAVRIALRIAAALAVLLGGAALWRSRALVSDTPGLAVVSTPRGQRVTLRLPDGTDVVLAPASTIRYAVAAARGPRLVYLDGEASFLVTHQVSRPFTVRTRHGVTTDLGTRFVVQAYPDDSIAAVAVAEGAVSLRAVHAQAQAVDSLLLMPHTAGAATVSGRLIPLSGGEVERVLGWIDGRLEFRETPMTDVAAALRRWYDLDLRLADEVIAQKRLTASFKNEPVSEVLRLIAATLGARADRRGNTVIISNSRPENAQ